MDWGNDQTTARVNAGIYCGRMDFTIVETAITALDVLAGTARRTRLLRTLACVGSKRGRLTVLGKS